MMASSPGTEHQVSFKLPAGVTLAIDWIIFTLQVLSIIGNGFIIYLFIRSKRLRKNVGLRLILLLSVTDWIFAVSAFPYVINYIVYWNPVQFNYEPYFLVISSLCLTIQFKINLVIELSIAIDRFQAMRFPVYYRRKNQNFNMWLTLAGGILLAAIDVTLEFLLTDITPQPGCAAIGCFVSSDYKTWWGATNMSLDVAVIIFTFIVGYDLRKIQMKSSMSSIAKKESTQLVEANRLSIGILVCGMIFMMFPSSLVGIAEWAGFAVFKSLGPFYILGLLACGVSNSFIYIWLHLELRNAAKIAVRLKKEGGSMSAVSIIRTRSARSMMPSSRISNVVAADRTANQMWTTVKSTNHKKRGLNLKEGDISVSYYCCM